MISVAHYDFQLCWTVPLLFLSFCFTAFGVRARSSFFGLGISVPICQAFWGWFKGYIGGIYFIFFPPSWKVGDMGVFELFPLVKKGMISFCVLKTRNPEGGAVEVRRA